MDSPHLNLEQLHPGDFLRGVTFFPAHYRRPNSDWYPDQCQVCGSKFGNGPHDLRQGYASDAGPWWICVGCFEQLRDRFQWTVAERSPPDNGAAHA